MVEYKVGRLDRDAMETLVRRAHAERDAEIVRLIGRAARFLRDAVAQLPASLRSLYGAGRPPTVAARGTSSTQRLAGRY
jgi:hypothetical protein